MFSTSSATFPLIAVDFSSSLNKPGSDDLRNWSDFESPGQGIAVVFVKPKLFMLMSSVQPLVTALMLISSGCLSASSKQELKYRPCSHLAHRAKRGARVLISTCVEPFTRVVIRVKNSIVSLCFVCVFV